MENRALLLASALLASLAILFSGCITHKEGYVNGTSIINGSALAQNMDRYVIEAGAGMHPTSWTMIGVILVNGGSANRDETFLGEINTSMLPDGKYTIRLTVTDKNGVTSEDRVYVNIDNIPDAQIRSCPVWTCGNLHDGSNFANISLSADQYGSNMDCSVDCACEAGSNMSIKTEGDLEYDYDYLIFRSRNLTGMWQGAFSTYNTTERVRFTSDRSQDGSTGYGGFNISEIFCSKYCFSSGSSDAEYISRVALSTGIMSSNKSSYASYDSVLTALQRGYTYTLEVDVTTTSPYDEYVKAWVDYNQDYDLNSTGEEINMGKVKVNKTHRFTKTFTVPANAILGRTKMRITDSWISAPTPCSRAIYGEVEDYVVEIVDSIVSTTSSTSTTIPGQCSMPGDDPPCGEVSMGEVVTHINKWAAGNAQLSEVIALINAWANGN
jgi:hypothetical protein